MTLGAHAARAAAAKLTGREWRYRSGWKLVGGSLPRVSAVRSTTQSVTDTTQAALVFNDITEDYDTDTMHSTSTNPSRITIPTDLGGCWRVGYSVYFANTASLTNGLVQTWVAKSAT